MRRARRTGGRPALDPNSLEHRRCRVHVGRIVPPRDPRQRSGAGGAAAGVQGIPGQEGDTLFLALDKHILGRAVGKVVAVLNGDDRRDASRSAEFVNAHVRESDVTDFCLGLQVGKRAHGVLERHA